MAGYGYQGVESGSGGNHSGDGGNLANRSWRGYRSILIGLAAMLLFYQLQVSPIYILLGAGILGYIFLSPPEAE